MYFKQYSQTQSFGCLPYSSGNGEKYHVSISYFPNCTLSIYLTFVICKKFYRFSQNFRQKLENFKFLRLRALFPKQPSLDPCRRRSKFVKNFKEIYFQSFLSKYKLVECDLFRRVSFFDFSLISYFHLRDFLRVKLLKKPICCFRPDAASW